MRGKIHIIRWLLRRDTEVIGYPGTMISAPSHMMGFSSYNGRVFPSNAGYHWAFTDGHGGSYPDFRDLPRQPAEGLAAGGNTSKLKYGIEAIISPCCRGAPQAYITSQKPDLRWWRSLPRWLEPFSKPHDAPMKHPHKSSLSSPRSFIRSQQWPNR